VPGAETDRAFDWANIGALGVPVFMQREVLWDHPKKGRYGVCKLIFGIRVGKRPCAGENALQGKWERFSGMADYGEQVANCTITERYDYKYLQHMGLPEKIGNRQSG
jgi:hypothetical protein